MKRTEYICYVGKRNGYDEYRTVVTDGERFFVNYKKNVYDVTEDVLGYKSRIFRKDYMSF